MSTPRPATQADLAHIEQLHRNAFGDEGGEIVTLVNALLTDPGAEPLWSLVARDDTAIVGHILFTAVHLDPPNADLNAQLLAPLGVAGTHQRRGIGGELIRDGLRRLTDAGVDLVFVLGWPDYYSRFGFRPAGERGFEAPYPIAEKNADAWMVLALRDGIIGKVSGTVRCADALDDQRYWVE